MLGRIVRHQVAQTPNLVHAFLQKGNLTHRTINNPPGKTLRNEQQSDSYPHPPGVIIIKQTQTGCAMRPLTQYKQVQKYSSAKHKLFDAYKTWFLAMLTTCSAALAFFPECTKCRWAALAALLILPAMLAVLFYRPKLPEQQYRNNFKIKVISGDILKQNGNCVIGFTNTFDTDTVHRIISNESLQGQFQNRIYQNDVSRLDDDLSKVLNKLEPVDTIAKKGKRKVYPLGTVVPIRKEGGGFWYCLAYTKMNEENVATAKLSELRHALDLLWEEILANSNGETVSLPLIGLGNARNPSMSAELSLHLVAFSYYIRSRESVVCESLNIIINEETIENIDLTKFQSFLSSLNTL